MAFSHSSTSFPLTGQHATTQCKQCHTSLKFAGTPADCFSCHGEDFRRMRLPDHQRGQFSHDCSSCHTPATWKPSSFDHRKTNFQLTGAHLAVDCATCHVNSKFAGTPTDCYGCHRSDFAAVVTPNHQKSQFSHDCTTCHSLNGWKPSTFDHARTNFPLQGAHRSVDCFSCHSTGQFTGTPSQCYSCHQADFRSAKAPDHAAGQLSHDCVSCHSLLNWRPSSFDHARTNFPLFGAHVTADCATCHTAGRFTGIATDCFSCHQADFTKTKNPDHTTGQLSHDCTTCHTSMNWNTSTFDHSKSTFQLTGAHTGVECATCHRGGKFTGAPTTCFGCHQSAFTSAPSHMASQYPHDCTTCHSTGAWTPSSFNHSNTAFPLRGAHMSVQCSTCHTTPQFQTVSVDCYSCHQNDFNQSKSPSHQLNQFSHDCQSCHGVTVWKPSTFNHSSTSFPLTGAHQTTDCLFCHKAGQFKQTNSACIGCHLSEFNGVADPNHVAGRFDANCITCHTTFAWKPATFDHNKTTFALTGAHIQTQCSQCHAGNRFAGTPTDCYSCHKPDYDGATNPVHATASYPVTCTSCHATSAWRPSTFDHTPYFPISSGSVHRPGRWNFCSDCHTVAANPKTFECINCHTHQKSTTDSQHRNRSGYLYASASCYKCHPQGR